MLTSVQFEYPEGVRADGKLETPEGKAYDADPKVRIYEGTVVFIQPIKIETDVDKMVCTVTYQACDETICMPPVTEKIEIINIK